MTLYAYNNKQPIVHPSNFVAPSAIIIGDVYLAEDASVWFQTVIRADLARISIGQRTNVQDLCMCHADEGTPLTIGNDVTIGHNCVIHGCTIEDSCLIGMGAVVMNRAHIGEGSIIAAGAVVLEDMQVPPHCLVAGSPGKIKKHYGDKGSMAEHLNLMARHYVNSARSYDRKSFIRSKTTVKQPPAITCPDKQVFMGTSPQPALSPARLFPVPDLFIVLDQGIHLRWQYGGPGILQGHKKRLGQGLVFGGHAFFEIKFPGLLGHVQCNGLKVLF